MYADKHLSTCAVSRPAVRWNSFYKFISKLAVYPLFFCSCFFFPKPCRLSRLFSPHSSFANIRNPLLLFLLLISTTNFEKATSYFFTSNSAFSQAYILRVRPLFSPAETSFTALSFRSFRNNFLFRYMPSQKAITIK